MAESKDAIDAAIQSAEYLFASLLDRTTSTGSLTVGPGESLSTTSLAQPGQGADSTDSSATTPTLSQNMNSIDPESSLMPPHLGQIPPDQSLHTMGVASLTPDQLTAHTHAALPPDFDPAESLHALVLHASSANLPESPDYNTVLKMLKDREKDLELAAKIGQTLLQRNKLLEADLMATLDQRQQGEQQIAQLKHTISQKEDLLKLYVRDATERDAEAAAAAEGSEANNPAGWVHALAEECRELRESNDQLQEEASHLRKETADIEQKERELVQQCLTQFGEAKQRLTTLREEMEVKQEENQLLQSKLLELSSEHETQLSRNQQLFDESEILREQLTDMRDANTQLTHEISDLQERFQDTSVMLKEAQEEITALKEISLQGSSPAENGESNHVEQESIVREIEEALRKEIIAASTLPERPRSPNHYAHQRTMVVMETVRAATLATARRLERLASEAEKQKHQQQGLSSTPAPAKHSGVQAAGSAPFSPLATSSPNDARTVRSTTGSAAATGVSAGTAMSPTTTAAHALGPLSPTLSDAGSTMSMPDEMVRYRNQPYVAPEKLQIVKPLEGSMTLLKWKLLASPQLGGATTFFSDAKRPGVHLKKAQFAQNKPGGSSGLLVPEAKVKSLSVNDLSVLSTSSPYAGRRRNLQRKETGIHTKASQLTLSISSTDKPNNGMNNIGGLLPSTPEFEEAGSLTKTPSGSGSGDDDKQKLSVSQARSRGASASEASPQSSSFLSQMGSFLGSGWSKLGMSRSRNSSKTEPQDTDHHDHPHHHEPISSAASTEVGLAGLL